MGHARGPSDNPYNAFPPNYKSNREAFASPSCFAFPFVAHTEKANLEEKYLLLAQVRRKAAQLLRDTLGVFRVRCFLAMSFVSLPLALPSISWQLLEQLLGQLLTQPLAAPGSFQQLLAIPSSS